MDLEGYYKTIMDGIYLVEGRELGIENVCFCDERYYWGPNLKHKNLLLQVSNIRAIDVFAKETDENIYVTMIELCHIDDSGVEYYVLYIGSEMVPIIEQMLVKEVIRICEKESVEEVLETIMHMSVSYRVMDEEKATDLFSLKLQTILNNYKLSYEHQMDI